MSHVDLLFPVIGSAIPRDHGYGLYAAVSRIVPSVHEAKDVGIFPIRGSPDGNGALLLGERSTLRIRLAAERIADLLPLAGKGLEIDGYRLRVGVPRVEALIPAAALASNLVLIKIAHAAETGGVTPDLFLAAAKKKLTELQIAAEPAIQQLRSGPQAGQARRRIIRVKDQTHVGYAMVVQGLTAEESILLQEKGLGGRRGMGCGLFLAFRPRGD